jgi:hypothetical protein
LPIPCVPLPPRRAGRTPSCSTSLKAMRHTLDVLQADLDTVLPGVVLVMLDVESHGRTR